MTRTIIFAALALVLIGCASGTVGMRVGSDIPLKGFSADGDVTSTSSSLGFVGGASFQGLFSTWGFRVDPQVRTGGGSAEYANSIVEGSLQYTSTGTMQTSATFVDVPVLVVFQPRDTANVITPFFGVGGMMSLVANTTTTVNGSTNVRDLSTGSETAVSNGQQSTFSGLSDPGVALVFMGGVRIPMSESWDVRADVRVHQFLTENDLASYSLYLPASYRTIVGVSTNAASTTLGVSVGVFMKL